MIGRRAQTVLARVHAALYRMTGGRVGGRLLGMEQVLLATQGRVTGQWRTTPVSVFPLEDGTGRMVLVASDAGRDQHPHWYRNALVNPEVVIQRGRTRVHAVARPATGEERGRWWPEVVRAYAGYAGYQSRTDREIPLLVCEPVR